MDHVTYFDVTPKSIEGLRLRKVFGEGGYISGGTGTMGYGELLADSKMEPWKPWCECALYISEAVHAAVQYGERTDTLGNICELETDDVVQLSTDEWYQFCLTEKDSVLRFIYFVPACKHDEKLGE